MIRLSRFLKGTVLRKSFSFQKDKSPLIYVRNDRPFLLIPYEYEGVQHHYEPDYLVRLKNGNTLILETKGEEDDRARPNIKPQGAGLQRLTTGDVSVGGISSSAVTRL